MFTLRFRLAASDVDLTVGTVASETIATVAMPNPSAAGLDGPHALHALANKLEQLANEIREQARTLQRSQEPAPLAAVEPARRETRVYISVDPVMGRRTTFPTAPSYRATLVARGTGTVMYRGKTCDTREQARTLARRHLAKNPHLVLDEG